jgi:hypothetical protein
VGLLKRLVMGRWLTRWLLRGSPLSVGLKLGGVALWGVWRWRRDERRRRLEQRRKEIDAEYEVVPPGRLETGPSRNPAETPGYGPDTASRTHRESIRSDPQEETS